MSLVLTTPTNPGTAAWTNATALPGARLPFSIVALTTGAGYLIPDGDDEIIIFDVQTPDTIELPLVVDNPGRTLILTATGLAAAAVVPSGADGIGPYGLPLSLDPTGSPRLLQLAAVAAASTPLGQDFWLVVSVN
jgi:hypothetical protein